MWYRQPHQYARQALRAWRASLIVVIALSVRTCGTVATRTTPTTTPATVYGPHVYLAAGDLYALQADTGTILWRLPRLANTSVFQPPAIAGNVLYTAAATPNTSFVYAYRLGDRSLLWRRALDHPVVAPVVAIAGTVYVGLGETSKADPPFGATCALRASDGAQLWCYTVGAPVWAAPTVVDGVVFDGSTDDSIYAVRASDGALLWRSQTGNAILEDIDVTQGIVYATSEDDTLYALRASDGTLLWRFRADALLSVPVVAGDNVYVSTHSGALDAVRTSDGALNWQMRIGGDIGRSVAASQDTVYAGSNDGTLYALHADTGAVLWHISVSGHGHVSAPTLSDGTLYGGVTVPTGLPSTYPSGIVFSLNAASGTLHWSRPLPAPPFLGVITIAP